jgi:hypothetical protein
MAQNRTTRSALRNFNRPPLLVACGLVAVLAMAGHTQAREVINVDIQGQRNDGGPGGTDFRGVPTLYSGTGPVGGTFIPLDANSQTTGGSAEDIADGHTNGNADLLTVSDLDLGGSGIGFTIVGVGADNNTDDPDSAFSTLIFDYVFNNDGTANNVATPAFTFTGLTPNSTVDLYFYLQLGGITIPGATATSAPGPAPFDTGNTLFFNNVATSPTGTVSGVLTGAPGILGGFTIVTIPEPASLGTLALFCGATLLRRRANR